MSSKRITCVYSVLGVPRVASDFDAKRIVAHKERRTRAIVITSGEEVKQTTFDSIKGLFFVQFILLKHLHVVKEFFCVAYNIISVFFSLFFFSFSFF